jgi:hypothetical protein
MHLVSVFQPLPSTMLAFHSLQYTISMVVRPQQQDQEGGEEQEEEEKKKRAGFQRRPWRTTRARTLGSASRPFALASGIAAAHPYP